MYKRDGMTKLRRITGCSKRSSGSHEVSLAYELLWASKQRSSHGTVEARSGGKIRTQEGAELLTTSTEPASMGRGHRERER
jgi:hypothetical protein